MPKDRSIYLENIPRTLNSKNIQQAINNYLKILKEVKFDIDENNVYNLLHTLKRKPLESGPYKGVSAFEASNRIMTDLTILYGVKQLLTNLQFEDFREYTVEFGNESKNLHDISSTNKKQRLFGEAFNVAESFFQNKKSSSLKKLRRDKEPGDILLLLYNSEARISKKPVKTKENEYHIAVDIDL